MIRGLWISAIVVVCGIATPGLAQEAAVKAKPTVWLPPPSAQEDKIRAALDHRTEMQLVDTPLQDAIDFLEDLHQINILIDTPSLTAANVEKDVPVTLELADVSLRSTLNLVLAQHGLTFLIEDEVVKIVTVASASSRFSTRIYPIPDLAENEQEAETISDSIKAAAGVGVWSEKGGGSISYVHRSRSLVVRQTFSAHEDIVEMLKGLRLAATMQERAASKLATVPVY